MWLVEEKQRGKPHTLQTSLAQSSGCPDLSVDLAINPPFLRPSRPR